MNYPGKALILGDDVRSFLATVRSLGRAGIQVHTGWADTDSPALKSRYIYKYHQISDYSPDDNVWISEFENVLQAEQFDLVIPCNDQRILPLQRERTRLLKHGKIELLNTEIQRITSSKQESSELASRLGVPTARSIFVQTPAELEAALREFTPPYVIKPVASYCIESIHTRNEVKKAFSYDKACSIGYEVLKKTPLQIQENFAGRGTGVEFLAINGEIKVIFQHLRVHEPIHGGGSSYRTSIAPHAGMKLATEAIVGELNYDGVGMIEFKWEEANDRFIFIEVNARLWGSLPLAIACGADFPSFLYDYRVHGRKKFPSKFTKGLYARNWVLDVEWLRANAAADRNDPALMTLPWRRVAMELWHVATGRERLDTLTIDDPAPFIYELASWIRTKLQVLGRTALQKYYEQRWVRARQARHVMSMLRSAKNIEFVCYGNICRSPFAEAIFRKTLGIERTPITFGSSGFHEHVGRQSPDEAIAAAQEHDVDLASHRSRRVGPDAIRNSDIIFVFDWKNYNQLTKEFPEARRKTFLLGTIDQERPISIADPWGESLDKFRSTYARIEQIANNILSRS